MRLIEPDRDLFLKGRRAESAGLGIGAFTYYRRIVEANKDRLLDEVIRLARHEGVEPSIIKKLESAKSEVSFSKALKV